MGVYVKDKNITLVFNNFYTRFIIICNQTFFLLKIIFYLKKKKEIRSNDLIALINSIAVILSYTSFKLVFSIITLKVFLFAHIPLNFKYISVYFSFCSCSISFMLSPVACDICSKESTFISSRFLANSIFLCSIPCSIPSRKPSALAFLLLATIPH